MKASPAQGIFTPMEVENLPWIQHILLENSCVYPTAAMHNTLSSKQGGINHDEDIGLQNP